MEELVETLGLQESLLPLETTIEFSDDEIAALNNEIDEAVRRNEIALSLSVERLAACDAARVSL